MRRTNQNLYSLIVAATCMAPSVAMSAIRVTNVSRNNKSNAYQQVNTSRYQDVSATPQVAAATPQGVISTTPVVQPSTATQPETTIMDRCAAIYPNGEFAWARPTAGMGAGGAETCTAVVKMLALGAGDNGADAVVATVNLAAGDSIRCNIDEFPESSYSATNIEISVPADKEPTMDDVIQIMNQEQKQNAAIKIISTAVIGGLGGNAAGDNAPGTDSLLGGGKDKIQGTVIGALGGAALSAASIYSGKVAGDMIMSAGVNAAAGSVIGNIAASGDSVMRIDDCTYNGSPAKCLWGIVEESENMEGGAIAYLNKKNINDFKVCVEKESKQTCTTTRLTNVKVDGYTDKTLEEVFRDEFKQATGENYCYKDGQMVTSPCDANDDTYVKVTGQKITKTTPAVIVGVSDQAFGYKASDLNYIKQRYSKNTIHSRSGNGIVGEPIKDATIDNFKPVYLDADDGSMIDMDSKARLKGTLTGAGVGGAMGAFTAYQGAQSEIEQRWVSEVRAYKDSLQKVVCMTGNRFLSQYNDPVSIPPLSE